MSQKDLFWANCRLLVVVVVDFAKVFKINIGLSARYRGICIRFLRELWVLGALQNNEHAHMANTRSTTTIAKNVEFAQIKTSVYFNM